MSNSEINFANLKPLNQQDNDDLLKLVKQIHVIIYQKILKHNLLHNFFLFLVS